MVLPEMEMVHVGSVRSPCVGGEVAVGWEEGVRHQKRGQQQCGSCACQGWSQRLSVVQQTEWRH